MPITVQHDPSAAAMGGAAYTGGQLQRRERDLDRAREDAARRAQLIVQQVEAEKNRQLRREEQQGQLSYYNQRENRIAEERATDRQFRQQVYEEAPALALEESLKQQELLKDRFKWGYNEQQKREMSKIQNAIGWTRQQVSSGEWTPEQAEVAERQLWQKYHAIVPSLMYDDSSQPIDIFNKRRVIHPDTGEELFLDKNNRLYKVADPNKEIAAKMTIEAADLAGKLMLMKGMKGMKGISGDEVPLYSPERALALAKQIYGVKSEGEQPTGQEGTEPQITLDQISPVVQTAAMSVFEDIIAGLKTKYTTATEEAMTEAGEKFVSDVQELGIPENIATDLWLSYWREEYKKRGVFKDDVVPKPPEGTTTASVEPSKPPEPKKQVWVKSVNPKTGNTVWTLADAPTGGPPAPANGKVRMRDPNGKMFDVDESEAEEAIKHGWVRL